MLGVALNTITQAQALKLLAMIDPSLTLPEGLGHSVQQVCKELLRYQVRVGKSLSAFCAVWGGEAVSLVCLMPGDAWNVSCVGWSYTDAGLQPWDAGHDPRRP
eukprot:COSAG01_NODE_6931_length_3435_cov_18.212530_2_plen_103_part_00